MTHNQNSNTKYQKNKKRTKSPNAVGKTPFEKQTQKMHKTNLQVYSEMFNERYNKFFRILNPLLGVRGKRLNLYNLKYIIEEIYSIRFIKDTSTLRSQLNKAGKNNQEVDVKDPFPFFIVEFFMNKFVKKPMVDQNALDLLLSIDTYRTANKEIEIFAKFLNEEYDCDDLIFFLFVRSCIEKEMKMMFIEKAKEEIKVQYNEYRDEIDTELYLNIKVCLKIANTIFGNEEELLLNSFMEKVEKQIILNNQAGKKKNLIKASTILEITLEDYHQSRKLYGQDTSIGNFDKTKPGDGKKLSLTDEKLKDENLFDEFYEDNENSALILGTKRVSLNKLEINEHSPPVENKEAINQEKINKLKTGIFNYIKEKELDT